MLVYLESLTGIEKELLKGCKCNEGLGVAEIRHEDSLCQTELDLTEKIDNYGVQISVGSLLPFSHSVQAR